MAHHGVRPRRDRTVVVTVTARLIVTDDAGDAVELETPGESEEAEGVLLVLTAMHHRDLDRVVVHLKEMDLVAIEDFCSAVRIRREMAQRFEANGS